MKQIGDGRHHRVPEAEGLSCVVRKNLLGVDFRNGPSGWCSGSLCPRGRRPEMPLRKRPTRSCLQVVLEPSRRLRVCEFQ